MTEKRMPLTSGSSGMRAPGTVNWKAAPAKAALAKKSTQTNGMTCFTTVLSSEVDD
jgi:hypothetical protein